MLAGRGEHLATAALQLTAQLLDIPDSTQVMVSQQYVLPNRRPEEASVRTACAAVLAYACNTGLMPYAVVSMTVGASHVRGVCQWKAYMEAMSELLRTAACWAEWLVVEGTLEGSPASPNAAPRLFSSLLQPACSTLRM